MINGSPTTPRGFILALSLYIEHIHVNKLKPFSSSQALVPVGSPENTHKSCFFKSREMAVKYNAVILLMVMVAAAILEGAAAKTYHVGDNSGWQVPTGGFSFSNWTAQHSFVAGDILGKSLWAPEGIGPTRLDSIIPVPDKFQ